MVEDDQFVGNRDIRGFELGVGADDSVTIKIACRIVVISNLHFPEFS